LVKRVIPTVRGDLEVPAGYLTDSQREAIKILRANGESVELIARLLGVSLATLRDRAADELQNGPAEIRGAAGLLLTRYALDAESPHHFKALTHWLERFGGAAWQAKRDEPATLTEIMATYRAIADQARLEAAQRHLDPGLAERPAPGTLPN
jgi:hypothetical protein